MINLQSLSYHTSETGGLCVVEGLIDTTFDIQRVFSVSAKAGEVRGDHAHKKCSQFMVCVSGSIEVTCDNGLKETTYQLNNPSIGLNIPNGIWTKEKYLTDNSVLMVLCDRYYEEDDYIHNYNDFKSYIK